MSNKKLVVLAITAVIAVILAVYVSKTPEKTGVAQAELGYLIQGLDPQVIDKIQIEAKTDKVTLQRKDGKFVVSQKDAYTADVKKNNTLITSVLDTKINEKITENPDNFNDLEVAEDNAKVTVKFFNAEDKLITGIIAGKQAAQGNSYVRLIDSDIVYLGSDVPWVQSKPIDYINTELTKIAKDKISKVIVSDNEKSYTLIRDPNTDAIKMLEMPTDKKLKADNKQVFEALTSLNFSDVSSIKNKLLNFDSSYVCNVSPSTIYTLDIAKEGENTYAKCAADFTDKTEVIKARKVESAEELKQKEEILLQRQAVDKFNTKHQGWVYQLPDHKAKNLTKKAEELLEDIEKPKDVDQPAPAVEVEKLPVDPNKTQK
jgi:hypothetical protein